jgi:hypothetical protein
VREREREREGERENVGKPQRHRNRQANRLDKECSAICLTSTIICQSNFMHRYDFIHVRRQGKRKSEEYKHASVHTHSHANTHTQAPCRAIHDQRPIKARFQ